MSEDVKSGEEGSAETGIAWQQALLDDVFMLLTFGLAVPTLLYIVWGLIELSNLRIFVP